ncbi:DUF2752 domain-containing protein [Actinomadura kijaniata]|uniref:DUF2752 domain-containing protein n=1 Tax=Actinomadura kijaniata TaxID=46161 RepID=UPI003F1E0721
MTRAPAPVAGTGRALLLPLAVLAGVAAAVAVLAVRDPHEPGHYPACPFLTVTGLYCPGCGGLRMVNALAHGRVGAAFDSNPLAFLLLPVAAWLWAVWTVHRARGLPTRSALLTRNAGIALLAVAVAFGIARNLPFGSFLAP